MTSGVDFRRIWLLCAALLGMAVSPSPLWAGACPGRIGPETSITGKTAYDPFNAADLVETYHISISNTGGQPCRYGLLFRSRTARPALGGTLLYDIASGSQSLLTTAAAARAPLARLDAPPNASATGAVELRLTVPRGQFAAPGVYRDTIDLELYALGDTGRVLGSALQVTTLAISYTVPQILSVNIAGAEETTVSFGTLAEGQERTVAIQVRSNLGYQLDVNSHNRSTLMLTPKVPGGDWSVPYTAALARQRLDLAGGSSLRSLPPTRPESDATYPLTVTIGTVGQKRAGRYEDVITVAIKAP
jgi:hypothetical protein